MKVILYMALTANGMIAKQDGNSEWVSPEDTEAFLKVCNTAGAVIMGKHTYDYLTKGDANESLPLKDGLQIVMSGENLPSGNTIFTSKTPEDILKLVEDKGYTSVVVMGGAKTASIFMKKGLVNEIYFDIEPLVFGKGISISTDADFECKLELIETKKLNGNTVQLHYRVLN